MENLNENLKELFVLSNKCIDPTDITFPTKEINFKDINIKLEKLIDPETKFFQNIREIEKIFDNLFLK